MFKNFVLFFYLSCFLLSNANAQQGRSFNWEYQCFATYNKNRAGLWIFNGETIVACVADHKKEVFSALSIVPHGRGKIILCALDIFSCLKDLNIVKRTEGEGENASMSSFNASQKNKANVVGQQLLLNLLRYSTNNSIVHDVNPIHFSN